MEYFNFLLSDQGEELQFFGRLLLQVAGRRSQVTGCRLQVTGHRSQVAGRIKIKKQSVILAIQELPEIPKRFHEQVSLCKYLPHK